MAPNSCRNWLLAVDVESASDLHKIGDAMKTLLITILLACLIPGLAAAQQVLFTDDFEDGFDPAWVQPNGGWVCEDGHMRNTTTCGFQSCIPDIWAGGPQFTDYLLSFDLSLASGNLYVYVMADVTAEHEQGQTGAYAVDAGIGDGNCGGYINDILPWPNFRRMDTRADQAFCFDPARVYRVKFGRISGDIVYKSWPKDEAEPSGWMLQAADDIHHSGYWGFGFWNGLGWIDNVLVEALGAVPVEPSSWGGVKAQYR
jgi:hypothetical protein